MLKKFFLKYFDQDRKFMVYAAVVFFSSVLVFLAELYIINSFQKTSTIVLDRYENRIKEYSDLLGLDNNDIDHLATLMQADSTQDAALRTFLGTSIHHSEKYPQEDALRLLEESKNILSYQMQEVKTEYQALEIWVALLTVVFLVFSFYSFYKMDRMIEKGTAQVKEFDEESKAKVAAVEKSLDLRIDKIETRNNKTIKNLVEESNYYLSKTREDNERVFGEYREKFKESIARLDEGITSIMKMSQENSEYNRDIQAQIKDIQNTISSVQHQMPLQKQTVDGYSLDVELLQAEMRTINERVRSIEIEASEVSKFEKRIIKLEKFMKNNT